MFLWSIKLWHKVTCMNVELFAVASVSAGCNSYYWFWIMFLFDIFFALHFSPKEFLQATSAAAWLSCFVFRFEAKLLFYSTAKFRYSSIITVSVIYNLATELSNSVIGPNPWQSYIQQGWAQKSFETLFPQKKASFEHHLYVISKCNITRVNESQRHGEAAE